MSIETDKLKHLRNVLRMEWGEDLLIIDGAGRLLEATLEKAGDGGIATLGAVKRIEERTLPLELVVALPKNATMDRVVEKAVECGATHITPVVSSRSVVRPGSGEGGKYARRWQTIIDEAVEQSERLWRPQISDPISWDKFLVMSRDPRMQWFAFLSELRTGAVGETEIAQLNACWKALRSAHDSGLGIIIGPEGGFSGTEREELLARGFIPVSLGTGVLRVETAVVAALTLARVIRTVSVS